MIVEILIYVGCSIINIFSLILPSWGIPDGIINALSNFTQSISSFNGILPVFTLVNIVTIIIAYHILKISVGITLSVFNWIRGSGELKLRHD